MSAWLTYEGAVKAARKKGVPSGEVRKIWRDEGLSNSHQIGRAYFLDELLPPVLAWYRQKKKDRAHSERVFMRTHPDNSLVSEIHWHQQESKRLYSDARDLADSGVSNWRVRSVRASARRHKREADRLRAKLPV